MKNSLLLILFLLISCLTSYSFSQNKKIEGLWLACVSENDCDDSKSGVYIKFEDNKMRSIVKASGLEVPYGDELQYKFEKEILVVSKQGESQIDRYIIKIEGDKMTMTHTINKSVNYLRKR